MQDVTRVILWRKLIFKTYIEPGNHGFILYLLNQKCDYYYYDYLLYII